MKKLLSVTILSLLLIPSVIYAMVLIEGKSYTDHQDYYWQERYNITTYLNAPYQNRTVAINLHKFVQDTCQEVIGMQDANADLKNRMSNLENRIKTLEEKNDLLINQINPILSKLLLFLNQK